MSQPHISPLLDAPAPCPERGGTAVTIETLKYIYTAYKCGSYQEAADILSVTHSVVAKQVARGEAELGVRLFERASKSKAMKLSPMGEALIEQIDTILRSYDEMQLTIQSLSGQGEKTLHIGYGYYVPCEEELSIMSGFQLRYPNVVVSQRQYSPEELHKLLGLSKLDGAFLAALNEKTVESFAARYPEDKYDRIPVSRNNTFHFLMSPDNPLARRSSLSLKDRDEILRQTILINGTCGGVRRMIPSELAAYLGLPQEKLKMKYIDSSNHPMLSFTLRDGDYLYPTARRVTQRLANIVAVPIEDWSHVGRLFFVSPKSVRNAPLLRFQQCVRDYAEQEEPSR